MNVSTGETACAATPAVARDTVTSARATLLLARFWEHADYKGSYMSIYGSHQCTATYSDKDYTRGDLGAAWNDRISSLKTYNRCDARLYEHVHGGGDYTPWIDSSSYLGSWWNDRASSIRLS